MSPPQQQSFDRRGFIARMAAISAAAGAFALSARAADAASLATTASGERLGSARHAASERSSR
jgi:hypothetical protein